MKLILLLMFACPKTVETEAEPGVSPALPATHVQAKAPAGAPMLSPVEERDRVLVVLQTTADPALDCYNDALSSQADLYGELRVRLKIAPDGTVPEVATTHSTLRNPEMESCVHGVVKNLAFPVPSKKEGLTVSYPFLFTSDLTPANIVRGLKIKNGLLDPATEYMSEEPDADPVDGEEGWWSAW
jgi:outer membrane biosynthesis protein TonB